MATLNSDPDIELQWFTHKITKRELCPQLERRTQKVESRLAHTRQPKGLGKLSEKERKLRISHEIC